MALRWPSLGAAIAAATAAAGVVDLAGGRSWIRVLAPRRGHRNVLLWAHDPAPDPFPGPWPGRAQHPEHTPPQQTLLVLPADPRRSRWSWAPAWGALFGAASLITILVSLALPPQTALATHTTVVIVLSLLAAVALSIGRRDRGPRAALGVAAARAVVERLHTERPAGHRLGVVIVGGMEPWFDGIEVLLRSRGRRLPAWRTRLVVWHPGPAELSVVTTDGPFGSHPPSELLRAAQTCSIPEASVRKARPWRTGALRARRLGWPSIGLVGGTDNAPTIDKLARMLREAGHMEVP